MIMTDMDQVEKYMPSPPKGRDIMAVYTFYSGEVIEQKYEGYVRESPNAIGILPTLLTWDASLPDLESLKFLALGNGVIRQTKDIEKVMWSYC